VNNLFTRLGVMRYGLSEDVSNNKKKLHR
jgi:hypothetical protein